MKFDLSIFIWTEFDELNILKTSMTSSFSIWGCVLKGCFERGILWSTLKGQIVFEGHWRLQYGALYVSIIRFVISCPRTYWLNLHTKTCDAIANLRQRGFKSDFLRFSCRYRSACLLTPKLYIYRFFQQLHSFLNVEQFIKFEGIVQYHLNTCLYNVFSLILS